MLIKKDPDIIRSYFEDCSYIKGGHAEAVAIPENPDELRSLLVEASLKKIPVTISGGGTSTTGSRVPFGGIVVSMERFNKIIDLSAKKMSATVGPGVLVDDLKNACEKDGLFYASHPTEKTAFVGGTVATNASGARSFKYGSTRKYIKRLKMLFADGDGLDIKRGERILTKDDPAFKTAGGSTIKVPLPSYKVPKIKNSAGYFTGPGKDLIDLFIGQEGTLSVITEIEFGLVPRPEKIMGLFIFFKKEEDSWRFCDAARGLDLLSMEYFDNNALRLLREKDTNVPEGAGAAIFLEQEATVKSEGESIDILLKLITEYGVSGDDVWAGMTGKEEILFTELRHHIPEAINDRVRLSGFRKFNTDIAVPRDNFTAMMRYYKDSFAASPIEHFMFGHIGECHVHVNLIPRSNGEMEKAQATCLSFIRKAVSLGGTVSAEHGVGKTKHEYLEIMYGEAGVIEMARIKKALDPGCILGLDNIFPRGILDLT